MSESSTIALPGWVRAVLIAIGLFFGYLAYWLAGRVEPSGFPALAGSVIAAVLAVVLLIGAARGRVGKWVWLVPGP